MPQDPQEPVGPPLVDDPDVDGRDEDDDIDPEAPVPKNDVPDEDGLLDPVL